MGFDTKIAIIRSSDRLKNEPISPHDLLGKTGYAGNEKLGWLIHFDLPFSLWRNENSR
jgi:hypothetical protein